MKKAPLLPLAAMLLALSCAHAQSLTPACPTANGTYFLDGERWVGMDSSHSVGWKTTNVAGAAFSYGAGKAKVKAQFRDSKSPYQLKGSDLAICLVGVIDSGRDLTLAKFQEENDRRELAMASYRLWTGINAQIDPASLIPITVDKKADKVYLISSRAPLPSGEFILFTIIPDVAAMAKANTPGSLGGYDSGSHSK